MEIHQILHVAAPGDAVTNSALAYQQLLRRVTGSEIYAVHVDPRLRDDVHHLSSYGITASARAGRSLLVYHLSTGSPEVTSFIRSRPEELGVIFHNVTPAHFFEPFDQRMAAELVRGREDIAALKERASFAIAVSAFNGRELEAAGYRNVGVVPLVADVEGLSRIAPDPTMARYLDSIDGPLILFVGQIQPHKRPDFLLAAHHMLTTYHVPEAHLSLVGPARLRGYEAAVSRYNRELNLSASLVGWVTEAQLAAFYRRATAFVTASEHEGFCVPVLEAMSFDVPVVARAFSALPDTIGDAGILLPQDAGPELMAEALAMVLDDAALRSHLAERGRRRVEAVDPQRSSDAFLECLLAWV